MTSVKLCNGDYDRPLKVEIWDFDDNGSHDFIGQFLTNVNEVILFLFFEFCLKKEKKLLLNLNNKKIYILPNKKTFNVYF